MPCSALDLFTTADNLLQAAYASGQTVGFAPDIVYVSVCDPPIDCCPMIAVHVDSVGQEELGEGQVFPDNSRNCATVTRARLVLTVADCVSVPEGNPPKFPSTGDMEQDTARIYSAGWAIWNGVRSWANQGCLFDVEFCQGLDYGEMECFNQGGCGGWRWPIDVEITGCPELSPSCP